MRCKNYSCSAFVFYSSVALKGEMYKAVVIINVITFVLTNDYSK